MLPLLRFDIEVECDDRPSFRVRVGKLSFDDGPDMIEEVRLKRRLVAVKDACVSQHRS
jgi:hypothetical protein